jgi:hypothetical protein
VRRSFLFVLVMTACGARTEVRDAPAFAIVYATAFTRLERWHSATGSTETLPVPFESFVLTCTRDGRFIALSDFVANQLAVLDASGRVLRTHEGIAQCMRPDGMRLMVVDEQGPLFDEECTGTLDADGTYGNEQCHATMPPEGFYALAYAPDASAVLWVHQVDAGPWTLSIAREDGSNAKTIATGTGGFVSGAWSPEGDRVAYSACTTTATGEVCKLFLERLDTLETELLVDEGTYLEATSFTPDGRAIVFMDRVATWDPVLSTKVRLFDLPTRSFVTLLDLGTSYLDGLCVTSN